MKINIILSDGINAEVLAYRKRGIQAIALVKRLEFHKYPYSVLTDIKEVDGRIDAVYHDCLNIYHANMYYGNTEVAFAHE